LLISRNSSNTGSKIYFEDPMPKLNFVYWVMISKRFESIFWVKNPLKVSAWNLEKILDPRPAASA
jgi:hypothetical protein